MSETRITYDGSRRADNSPTRETLQRGSLHFAEHTAPGSQDGVARRNEDATLILPQYGVAFLMDGLGGHRGYDASLRVWSYLVERYQQYHPGQDDPFDFFLSSIRGANEDLYAHESNQGRNNVLTTLTGAVVRQERVGYHNRHKALLVNQGDSRTFIHRPGNLVKPPVNMDSLQGVLGSGRYMRMNQQEVTMHPGMSLLFLSDGACVPQDGQSEEDAVLERIMRANYGRSITNPDATARTLVTDSQRTAAEANRNYGYVDDSSAIVIRAT